MREEKLLSLEQAVKKKMSDTAAQFNLAGRETIHEKAYANIDHGLHTGALPGHVL